MSEMALRVLSVLAFGLIVSGCITPVETSSPAASSIDDFACASQVGECGAATAPRARIRPPTHDDEPRRAKMIRPAVALPQKLAPDRAGAAVETTAGVDVRTASETDRRNAEAGRVLDESMRRWNGVAQRALTSVCRGC